MQMYSRVEFLESDFFSSKHISSRNLFHNITEYVHSGIKDGGDKKLRVN